MGTDSPSQLSLALAEENIEKIEELLQEVSIAELNTKKEGKTVLILASEGKNLDLALKTVKLLIDKNEKVDVFAKNWENETFLHVLLRLGKHEGGNGGWTPGKFHYLTEYLIGKGFGGLFEVGGGLKEATPLQLALKQFAVDGRTLDCFLKDGRDGILNQVDLDGNTPLFYSVSGGRSVPCLKELVERGANWNLHNGCEFSLLHVVAAVGNFEVLKYFLSLEGMDVNEQTGDGETPLHRVVEFHKAWKNLKEVVEFLKESGGDPEIANRNGDTVLDLAERKVRSPQLRKEIVDILKKCS